MKNKKFDCVEMKHNSAAKISERMSAFTRKQELEFWWEQFSNLKKHQEEILDKQKSNESLNRQST